MLPFHRFISSVLRVGLSSVGAQVVTFVTLPLLTRLYRPESFGIWALIQSAAGLIGAIATCRYELAVVLPKTNAEAASILGFGFLLAAFVSICSAICMQWVSQLMLGDIVDPRFAASIIPLLVFLTASYQLLLAWCTRNAAFNAYSLAQFGLAILTAAIPVALAWHSSHDLGLAIGGVIAYFLVVLVLGIWTMFQIFREELLICFSWRAIKKAGVQYSAYPLYMMPYTLLGTLRDRVVYFFLGNYAGASEAGFFSMAQRLTNAPNSLAAGVLRPVFFQHVTQDQQGEVGALIERIMLWLVVLVVPPVVFFCFFPESILILLLGEKWGGSSSYVMILVMPMLPMMLGNWMDRYFDALGRQKLVFHMEFIFSLTAIVVLVGAFILGAAPYQAVLLQSVVMAVYFTVWLFVLFKVAGIPLNVLAKTCNYGVLLATVTVVSVFISNTFARDLYISFCSFIASWVMSAIVSQLVIRKHQS